MIQRIQSAYLLAGLILMGLLFFLPAVAFIGAEQKLFHFFLKGLYQQTGGEPELILMHLPMIILLAIICLLYLLAIFAYRRRPLQMRLVIYNILLQAGSVGLIFYYLSAAYKEVEAVEFSYKLPVVFPVIAMILCYLAFRGIRKDELLVRSVDRIR